MNQGGLELLVNCITEGSLPHEAVQNDENSCFSKSNHDQCSDMKFCVDYKSEGANKHMSSQSVLKQLINSIMKDVSTIHVELYAVEVILFSDM